MARLAVLGRRVRLSPVRSHPKGQKGTQLEVSYSLQFRALSRLLRPYEGPQFSFNPTPVEPRSRKPLKGATPLLAEKENSLPHAPDPSCE